MADLINAPSRPSAPVLAAGALTLTVLVGSGTFLLVKMLPPQRPQQRPAQPAPVATPVHKAMPVDLTAQYYCYSQLSNFPPDYYQLFIDQQQAQISGSLQQLSGEAGSLAGNLDRKGNLQFQLVQASGKADGILGSLPFVSGLLGGGQSAAVFDFLGGYRRTGTGSTRLSGMVINRTAGGGQDAKPRRFFCDSDRPSYWGKGP